MKKFYYIKEKLKIKRLEYRKKWIVFKNEQIYDRLYDLLVYYRNPEHRAYLYFILELIAMFIIVYYLDY